MGLCSFREALIETVLKAAYLRRQLSIALLVRAVLTV